MLTGEWNDDEAVPQEWLDFELMSGMGWKWHELEAIPPYVKRYCRDFLRMQNLAAQRGSG